ncbi:hypothetical protein HDU97_004016 [Phlyctochytrium planicorne]|nr:hypothetical protein HDU97_004016 [Phlyctochytrium planicorne]
MEHQHDHSHHGHHGHHDHHGHHHDHHDGECGDAEHDHRHTFSEKAAAWDNNPEHTEASADAFKAISQRIPLSKSMKVIEIGCGTGLLSAHVAPHVSSLLGIDTAPGMVHVFNTKVGPSEEGKIPNMIAKEALLNDPNHPVLEGQKFDLALSHLTLHHIKDVAEFLAVIKGVLLPGGQLAFTDLEDEGKPWFTDSKIAHSHGVHRHGIRPDDISKLLADAGFSGIKVEKYGTMKKILAHEGGKEVEFNFIIILAQLPK